MTGRARDLSEPNEAAAPPDDAAHGRGPSLIGHARTSPDRMAISTPTGTRSFAELNARANQLVAALSQRGIGPGDAIALLCANRAEFAETLFAAARHGLRITPINAHLTGEEAGYIVENCEARAFVADVRFSGAATEAARCAPAARVRLSVGGSIEGFEDYAAALDGQPRDDPARPVRGSSMLYTSGTTGRPKGVHRRGPHRSSLLPTLIRTAAFDASRDVALNTGPLYHAAPLALNLMFPLEWGVGVVVMDRWDPEETLRLIERHRITHTHMVPTMFHRLLALPEEVRARYDVSSLRWVLHGAAPCPVHVKRAMIEWLGPVLYEYFAATEGGGTFADSNEWLERPGTVGRAMPGHEVEVRDDGGRQLPPGEIGEIWFRAPDANRFEYYGSPEKTDSAYDDDFFTLGDIGHFDEAGYLFPTGRSADLIISGGVNIYPAEIDAALLRHPAVRDVATIGVPNEEWGEEVKAVVLPAAGSSPDEDLAAALIEHCKSHLAGYKCPRSVAFTDELPRLPTGKILRRVVRARYLDDEKTLDD